MAEPTSVRLTSSSVLALSASSAQSAAVGAANIGQPGLTSIVRLVATVDTWLATGDNPTAAANTNGSFLLPAGVVEYIEVQNGHKIAGISSSAGYLSYSPGVE